jgi:hypothetical protein
VLGEDQPTVVADPRPNTNEPAADELEITALNELELHQLTLYKWRYSFEAYGFQPGQVRKLMFVKWLHATQRVQP